MVLILFCLGLILGSFGNVLIYRLNVENVPKFWQGRSICPHCKKNILWQDNIPLLSYILLKGRCRFCHHQIGWQYPVVELITALVFAFIWIFSPTLSPNVKLFELSIAFIFIVVFFSDLIYGLIPDEMVGTGVVVAILGRLLFWGDLKSAVLAGLGSGLAFFLIVLFTKFRGMGLGDVKLALLMGVLLGFPQVLVAFWSAFIIGGSAAVLLLILKKVRFSATIPLGPFLVLGVIISALWSDKLLALIGL